MERPGIRLPLLVNPERQQALLGSTQPPRLFLASQSASGERGEAPAELRAISDEDAGQLVLGDPNWACSEVLGPVGYLIDAWCERRCLSPLGKLLSSWPPNGLTDGAYELLQALRSARAAARELATELEWELLGAVESKLSQRLGGRG